MPKQSIAPQLGKTLCPSAKSFLSLLASEAVQTTFKSFEKEVIKPGEYFKDTSEKTYKLAGARVVKTRKANVTTIGFTHYVLQEYGKQD